MKTEFRNRAFLPVVLPVGILLVIGLLVGSFALILLYTTREVALVLATVAAGGILLAISLAASQERLDPARKAVVGLAGAFPVIVGVVVAVVQPGITSDMLNINRLPHVVLPDTTIEIAAENSVEFTADEMVLPAATEVGVIFENEEVGVGHNWAMFTDDTASEAIARGDVVEGPAVDEVIFETPDPGAYYYHCDVHPNMNGTVVVEEDAEPALD